MDPLERLDLDTVNIVFGYLSSYDIVRCERVGRAWRDCARGWMTTFGSRIKFPHQWNAAQFNSSSDVSKYQTFKWQAHRSHDVRQCEPSSARAFTDALTLVTVGNYVAWPTAVDYYDGPRLYWQFIPPSREGPAGEAKMVPLEKFFRYGSFPTTVDNVAMNRDGILLFRVHAISRVFYPFSGSRNIIYSPAEEKFFWCHHLESCPRQTLVPLLIGRRCVYCAVQNGANVDLAAYDFRTNELVYQRPVLNDAAVRGVLNMGAHFIHDEWMGAYRLIESPDGDELIVEIPSSNQATKPSISIINGTHGHFMQNLTISDVALESVVTDPTACYAAMVSSPDLPDNIKIAHSAFQKYHLKLIWKFSFQAGHVLTPLSVDAVFAEIEPEGVFVNLTVHPFTLGAITSRYPPNVWDRFAKMFGHSLVPAQDSSLHEAANGAVDHLLGPSSDTPRLNQCFVLGHGEECTLPPRPEIRRYTRHRTLQIAYLHFPYRMPRQVRFVTENRVLLRYLNHSYLLDFS